MFSFCVFCRIFEFRKLIGDREKCRSLVPEDYPVYINKVLHLLFCFLGVLFFLFLMMFVLAFCVQTEELADCRVQEGFFISPLEHLVPGILPPESVKARY